MNASTNRKFHFACGGCDETWTYDGTGLTMSLLLGIAAHVDYFHGQNLKSQIFKYTLATVRDHVKYREEKVGD